MKRARGGDLVRRGKDEGGSIKRRRSAPGTSRARYPAPPKPRPPAGPERLHKILAQAGVGSRRACEELILQGRVRVDGTVVRVLGTKVDASTARIELDGQPVAAEPLVYYAVYKPKGVVTTDRDPAGRPRVIDLIPGVPQRVYAVGRLDEASLGLLILTNDGELAQRLAHPRFRVPKVYKVLVAGRPTPDQLSQLTSGVWLSEGKARAERVRVVGQQGEATWLELVLTEGMNREVRRMLAKLGHKVMKLTRIAVGPITLRGLTPGGWRRLTAEEINLLKDASEGRWTLAGRERPGPTRASTRGAPLRAPRPSERRGARRPPPPSASLPGERVGGSPVEPIRRPPRTARPGSTTRPLRPGGARPRPAVEESNVARPKRRAASPSRPTSTPHEVRKAVPPSASSSRPPRPLGPTPERRVIGLTAGSRPKPRPALRKPNRRSLPLRPGDPPTHGLTPAVRRIRKKPETPPQDAS